jgi:D-alanyl-D-alanine carboxypeptidase (penicillin-binding protein 5/6)
LLCILIELIVLLTLGIMIGWDYGVGDWFAQFGNPVVKELDLSGIHSQNAVLMQVKGGKVIGEINGEEKAYPASLTKIMTTIVAIEELDDLDREITLPTEIFDQLAQSDATQAGFQPGENVRAIDLLYGVMLPSGAECSLALAYDLEGSEEAFVQKMNQKAQKLGMENTHFCDTTGLHDPEHYSTAFDMAILLKYALNNDTFREIIESPWHSTPATNVHPDGITYYSTMFQALSSTSVTGGEILGGKTGFTNEAGLCLASFAEIEGREYILVTMGASQNGEHIEDAQTVYNRLGEAAQALKE